jgi:thiamine-phosphate pyrophosphorylase
MVLPRLYAILDVDILSARSLDLALFVSELRDAGVTLLQYRNKSGNARTTLCDAALLREIFPAGGDVRLILNDRADLTVLSGFDGVHVGQEDLAPEDARSIVGPEVWVGVSTHSPEQVIEANGTTCDYIAYGPVFASTSKNNPDPTVGLTSLQMARSQTRKPLVAIGGITRENFRSVLDAGADSIAVISGLLPVSADPISQSVRQIAKEFIALLGS